VGVNLTDPVSVGLAASETRSGTNVTGTLIRVQGLTEKQLEIALELVPGTARGGVMLNPANPAISLHEKELQTAAMKLGISLVIAKSRAAEDIEAAFHELTRERVKIILIVTDAMFVAARRYVAAFALTNRIPAIFYQRENVEGGLWGQSKREPPPGGVLRGSNSQRRQTCRFTL